LHSPQTTDSDDTLSSAYRQQTTPSPQTTDYKEQTTLSPQTTDYKEQTTLSPQSTEKRQHPLLRLQMTPSPLKPSCYSYATCHTTTSV
ncbi:hypothetical protein Pcinc_030388, partial [Petrolisthes cinctipes]